MLNPFFKFYKKKFPDKIKNNNIKMKICTVNICTYFLTNVIKEIYWKLTSEMNIPEDKRSIINMKNEFFYKRIMLTKNKKNYGGKLAMQEGNLLDNPKPDIKGLPIRKVSVNPAVRDYFTELLDKDILGSKTINLGLIYGKYEKLQNTIKNSLENGSTQFSQPGKVNDIETYVNPYSIQSVRGTIIWNELFPNEEISLPTKVNMIKLTGKTLADLTGVPDEYYKIIKKIIFDNPKLEKFGFNVISLPKDKKQIPKWLIPFIDIETMVNDNVKSGLIMLESLGFKNLDILTNSYPTNILKF